MRFYAGVKIFSITEKLNLSGLHPSENILLYVTASNGSVLELHRLIMGKLGMKLAGMSQANMTVEMDCKSYLLIVLAGQSNLIDKLMYPGFLPLASRVVAKSALADSKQPRGLLLRQLPFLPTPIRFLKPHHPHLL